MNESDNQRLKRAAMMSADGYESYRRDFIKLATPEKIAALLSLHERDEARVKELEAENRQLKEAYNLSGMRAEIESLTAQLATLRDEWRPIEEAPKDGTRVLLGWAARNEVPGHVMVGFYGPKYSSQGLNYGDDWGTGTTWNDHLTNMTHWQPLPSPPEQSLKEPE
jgi:hypothetical protein